MKNIGKLASSLLILLLIVGISSFFYHRYKTEKLMPGEKGLLDNLTTAEKKFGLHHQETQGHLMSLARFYLNESLPSKASPLFERAVENEKQFYGPDNPWLN
jgi:hypothetical protein